LDLAQCGGNAPPPAQDTAAFVALGGIVSDNCGNASVTFVSDVVSGVSPQVITRTYRATDSCGNSQDCSQTIIINSGPVVTLNPSSQTVCPGNVSFSAAASGSPAPAVQWQVSTDGGVTF